MSRLKHELSRLSRYGAVGLATNLALYFAFVVLVWFGVAPVLVAGLCYIAGVGISYCVNRAWTFASQESHRQDLPKFLTAYGIGLVSTLVTIQLLLLVLRPELAQMINIGVTALVIYTGLRMMRFGERRAH